jgi:hypothetical protein
VKIKLKIKLKVSSNGTIAINKFRGYLDLKGGDYVMLSTSGDNSLNKRLVLMEKAQEETPGPTPILHQVENPA